MLTVPASFDEEARELTVEAARSAAFANLTLLEEPIAAFYAWIADQRTRRSSRSGGVNRPRDAVLRGRSRRPRLRRRRRHQRLQPDSRRRRRRRRRRSSGSRSAITCCSAATTSTWRLATLLEHTNRRSARADLRLAVTQRAALRR